MVRGKDLAMPPLTPTKSFPPWNGESFLHDTDRGDLCMWLAAPSVLVMKYRGYSDAGFMDFVETVWKRTLDATPDKVQIFADTEQQTGFDHSFRARMVRWNKRIVGRTDTYCLLVKSRWIAMGIALVRATLGAPSRHAEVTTNRDHFHARLKEAVRGSLNRGRDEGSCAATGGSPSSSEGGCDDR
jgi:hypothetical protein